MFEFTVDRADLRYMIHVAEKDYLNRPMKLDLSMGKLKVFSSITFAGTARIF